MNAIVINLGFTQPDQRTEGAGMHVVYDMLADRFDSRRETWLGVRVWDGNMEAVVDEILRLNAHKIVGVHYSWGAGKGLIDFAKALQAQGRFLDLACLVDPVPYVWGRWASQALMPGNGMFSLPENVKAFASWRTVNWAGLGTPWARDVFSEHAAELGRTAFGSEDAWKRYRPRGRWINDPDVIHGSIDNVPEVQFGIVNTIGRFIKGDA